MKQPINHDAYNDFWYFVNKRYKVFLKKEAGEEKPWSQDPIFQDWKFCNVFRKDDRQSRWMIDNIITPHWKDEQALLLFNIFAFRAFNWNTTFEYLTHNQNWFDSWRLESIKNNLKAHVDAGNKLTSGAYMIRGLHDLPKWESIAHVLNMVWEKKEKLLYDITQKNTLENAYNQIIRSEFWGWGPFTSYQVALDLTYSPILQDPPDINTWCEFGPGAKKGIREIWPDIPYIHEWLIEGANFLLLDQIKYREPHVPEMNLQDIEFCLCELGKFRRLKAGGRSKEKYDGKPKEVEEVISNA